MNQTLDPEFVERIVQEVIRRLIARGLTVGPDAKDSERELDVDDKVVTLATLQGRLSGVRRVVVGGRSIVTPAVKDELKDRSIELVRR